MPNSDIWEITIITLKFKENAVAKWSLREGSLGSLPHLTWSTVQTPMALQKKKEHYRLKPGGQPEQPPPNPSPTNAKKGNFNENHRGG